MRLWLASLLATALAACATSESGLAPVQAPLSVALGQRVQVGRYLVRPLSVAEDSRCPSGVRCIWAGRLIVYGLVDGPGVHRGQYFTLGTAESVGATTVTLSNATPERFAEGAVPPATYRFTFIGGR